MDIIDLKSKEYAMEYNGNSIADITVRLKSINDETRNQTSYCVDTDTEFGAIGICEYVHSLMMAPNAYVTFKKACELMASKEINDHTTVENGNTWTTTDLDVAKSWFDRVCGYVRDMIIVVTMTHPKGLELKEF